MSNGVANIPLASSNTAGVTALSNAFGLYVDSNYPTLARIYAARNEDIKAADATNPCSYRPIVPNNQHRAVYYGLSKLAGVDLASVSGLTIGVYPDNAKAAIKSMLGVQDSTQTVVVSGTTPTITALTNTRYICGEVSTLTITPPGAGICEVVFTSGSTPTVLTATGVTFPAWFDSSTLEANTTYEISIADGKGVVCTWAS